MKLKELLSEIEYQIIKGDVETDISDVIYDTRRLVPQSAFVCIKGAKLDSHTLADEAVAKGAVALIVEDEVEANAEIIIKTADTREALAKMAAAYFHHPAREMTTIGITASKGKTTTTYMVKGILEAAGFKTGLMGSIGAMIGDEPQKTINTTPESYEVQRLFREMADAGCKFAVMEVSSQGLMLKRTAGFTFDYGIFLNISRDHISPWEHKSLEEYLHCKSLLMQQCKVGFVNGDDPQLDKILEGHTCEVVKFGFGADNDIRVKSHETVSRPGYMGVEYETEGDMAIKMQVGVPGKFGIYDSMAAAAVCLRCGVPAETASTAIKEIEIRGRAERVKIDAPFTVLLDFAHNGIGVQNLVTAVRTYIKGKIIAVFGSDGNRTKIRRADAGEILGKMADLTVLTSNCPRFEKVEDINNDIKVGLDRTDGEYTEIVDRRSAIKFAMQQANEGDAVLLIGKGHWDYEEINGVKYPFDERKVVAELWQEIKAEK